MSNSIVVASFPAGCNNVRTDAKWQWDVGQTLQIDGLTLPTAFEAQFCLAGGEDNALAMVGENNLVTIPDELFEEGENIWCYIWLHDTEADGETVYKITIPVNERVRAEAYTPTPTQLDAVEQAIVALNNAVDQTAADVVATGENADAAAQSAENAAAASQAVQSMSVSADTLPAGSAATVEKTVDPDTGAVNLEFGIPTGATGAQGETGNGIQSITLHGQSGLNKVYRITFTNGDTFDFTVTDGNGIQSAILNADYTLTLTFQNGTSYTSPSIRGATGATGATGNGIQSIAKTGTSGNVDTYTITYTNGTTSTYTVTNGNVSSVAGKTGAVTLDADDVGYDDAETYASGTVGAELTQLNQHLNDLDDQVNDATTGLDTKAPVIINSASGAIASFSDGADGMPVKSLIVNIEPVQEGSGDPSPDNIRPISGWTGCEVNRIGKNWLKLPTWSQITASPVASGYYGFPIKVKPSSIYYLSTEYLNNYTSVGKGIYVLVSIAHPVTTWKAIAHSAQGAVNGALTSGASGYLYLCVSTGTTEALWNELLANCHTQLEEGSTATAYEEYQGTTLPITFPSSAGTVYGGTLDVTNGVLTVDKLLADIGSLTWSYDSSNTVFNTLAIKSPYATNADFISSAYKQTTGSISAMKTGEGQLRPAALYLKNENYTDAATFKTAMSGQTIVYPIATPIEYTLTAEQVGGILTTLYGQNNIWADTGDVSVEYCADTRLFIEQLTQPTEDDMTANANIAANTFFMIGNTLYYSTAAIAAGATIIPGTNCNLVSLADALNQLNS